MSQKYYKNIEIPLTLCVDSVIIEATIRWRLTHDEHTLEKMDRGFNRGALSGIDGHAGLGSHGHAAPGKPRAGSNRITAEPKRAGLFSRQGGWHLWDEYRQCGQSISAG